MINWDYDYELNWGTLLRFFLTLLLGVLVMGSLLRLACADAETLYLVQGDTRPAYPAVLRDTQGVVDLTGCTVTATVENATNGDDIVTDQPAIVTYAARGECEYRWASSDTNTVGAFQIQFKVLDADGNTSTYPASYDAGIVIRERY